MAQLSLYSGTTSKLVNTFIINSATGKGLTGLTNSTAGLTAYYFLSGALSAVAIALVPGTLGTWISGGFKEVDSVNMPGLYSLGIPDLVFDGEEVTIILAGAVNMVTVVIEIEITATNNQDSERGGLLALPNGSMRVAQNQALLAQVVMVSSADHVTPVAGMTVVSLVSINGATFVPTTNSVAGVSNGLYNLQLAAADMNGAVITVMFSATGCDSRFLTFFTQPD